MKRSKPFLAVGAWVLALVCCPGVWAQGFGLGASLSTNAVPIGTLITNTVNVTNFTGLNLANVLVTNTFTGSPAFQIGNFGSSQGTVLSNGTSIVIFNLGPLTDGAVAITRVAVRIDSVGLVTNRVVVATTQITNTATTNLVMQAVPLSTDLAVTVQPPPGPVLVNDTISYGLTVTNLGNNAASNVALTNAGFGAFKLLSLSPAGQAFTFTNGTLSLNLGSLAAKGGTRIQLQLQPTNAGNWALTSAVQTAGSLDANSTNNIALTNLLVEALVPGELAASNVSAMVYDPQTGLMKQTVRVTNLGTNNYGSARLIVSGLTNRLYNAVGTNDGNPYVLYAAPLDAGQSVDMVLEYFVPTRLPINVPNSAYAAYGMTPVNVFVGNAPAPNFTLITNLGAYGVLVEFEAVLGASYTVFYSDDASFTNARAAQPDVIAPGSRVQWIDNGPPKTVSHPSTTPMRMYSVRRNQ
jgi:hypothetical protein